MKKKPKLILLKSPEKEKPKCVRDLKSNSFWNTCPRQLECLPTRPCQMGKDSCAIRAGVEPTCEWGINSEEHNFCFWKYIQDKSTPDGKMEPMLQNDIAEKFGCSSTKIHFILKESMQKLRESEFISILADFFEDSNPDPGTNVSIDKVVPTPKADDSD